MPIPSSVRTQTNDNAIYSVTFSPNGQVLAWGSLDNRIKLWESGIPQQEFKKRHYPVTVNTLLQPLSLMTAAPSYLQVTIVRCEYGTPMIIFLRLHSPDMPGLCSVSRVPLLEIHWFLAVSIKLPLSGIMTNVQNGTR